MSLLLANTNSAFGHIRPLMPNTKQIGFAHIEPPQPLDDKNLKAFMDFSDVVIICFGSQANFSQISSKKLDIFVNVFKKLKPFNFVWKFDGKDENLPENVKTFNWLKISDALAHSNVKLFITHGGINSIYESIDREVPMVVFPLCWEQYYNSKLMVERKIAIELDLNYFTESKLEDAILTASSEIYKENVKNLKKVAYDQPMKPMEVAIESIEFVMRNKKIVNVHIEDFSYIIFVISNLILIFLVIIVVNRILKKYN